MVEFPVWVVQHDRHGWTGPYDIFEAVNVRDNGTVHCTRHDGRRQITSAGEWVAASEKNESAIRKMADDDVLCAEAEDWLEEMPSD